MTLAEIPNEIAVYFEIGGCTQQCLNCHSPHHQSYGMLVELDYLAAYTIRQAEQGATAALLMGGTTSRYLTKQNVEKIINRLSPILPVGLYSGAEVDDFFMSNRNLRWYKTGAYVDALGGLTSPLTNQRFYQRDALGAWEVRNDLFQTPTQRQEDMDL